MSWEISGLCGLMEVRRNYRPWAAPTTMRLMQSYLVKPENEIARYRAEIEISKGYCAPIPVGGMGTL